MDVTPALELMKAVAGAAAPSNGAATAATAAATPRSPLLLIANNTLGSFIASFHAVQHVILSRNYSGATGKRLVEACNSMLDAAAAGAVPVLDDGRRHHHHHDEEKEKPTKPKIKKKSSSSSSSSSSGGGGAKIKKSRPKASESSLSSSSSSPSSSSSTTSSSSSSAAASTSSSAIHAAVVDLQVLSLSQLFSVSDKMAFLMKSFTRMNAGEATALELAVFRAFVSKFDEVQVDELLALLPAADNVRLWQQLVWFLSAHESDGLGGRGGANANANATASSSPSDEVAKTTRDILLRMTSASHHNRVARGGCVIVVVAGRRLRRRRRRRHPPPPSASLCHTLRSMCAARHG
jgi:hypothetical protein